MRSPIRSVLGVLVLVALSRTGRAAPPPAADQQALAAVLHDLCPLQLVMLGESATHGDGHTEAFKVALVERLIDQCGFQGVFFEASHYEFLELNRQLRTGNTVSTDRLSAAIGGLWKFDREFQPLVPFLLAKAQSGQIALGGIDDQLGGLGQDYANQAMVPELASSLPQPQRQDCTLALHRRIFSDYAATAPYSPPDRSHLATCLSAMQQAVTADKTTNRVAKEEGTEKIAAVQRWISRDFTPDADQIVARDRSMVQNFTWLRLQTPQRRKIIVWSATVHIAKQGDPSWADHTGTNFGTLVHRQYGAQSFSLGFSALTGSFRQGRRDVRELPAAPADSLESLTTQGIPSDTVYLGPDRLATFGTVPGAVFRHAYQTLPWAAFLDGVVVFHEERPPDSTR